MSDYDFAQLTLEAVNRNSISGYQINTRLFVQRGFGSNFQYMLYL